MPRLVPRSGIRHIATFSVLAVSGWCATTAGASGLGTWTDAATMGAARGAHLATALPDGSVLVAGGRTAGGDGSRGTEIYDPLADAWRTGATMRGGRVLATMTTLADGEVLVSGGSDAPGGSGQTTAEVYDPALDFWADAASMGDARVSHTSTLLANGQVLVAGGSSSSGGAQRSAELYDPASDAWSPAQPMISARTQANAVRLSSGDVLVIGGADENGTVQASAELYRAATGTWEPTGAMIDGRRLATASLLPDGRVLVTGGYLDSGQPTASAELYDPASSTWSSEGSLPQARGMHTATALPSGKVLIVGGDTRPTGGASGSDVASAVIYRPSPARWTTAGSMHVARHGHTATLLADGSVLIAGGDRFGPDGEPAPTSSAERYQAEPADTAPPTISATAPADGNTYQQNQNVTVSFGCNDGPDGSGIEYCGGDQPDGYRLPTTSPGHHTFFLHALDRAGNETSLTVHYVIQGVTIPQVPGRIYTVAGGGSDAPDGVVATDADLGWVGGISPTPDGGYLIAGSAHNRIYKVSAAGTVTVVAGSGRHGYGGDGGPAADAALCDPTSVAALPDGSFIIADTTNNRIRRVDPSGTITTVAGRNAYGEEQVSPCTTFSGFEHDPDTTSAPEMFLSDPEGVISDGADGYYFTSVHDGTGHGGAVFHVGSDQIVRRVAGGGSASPGDGGLARDVRLQPTNLAIDAHGSLLIVDQGANRVSLVTPDGVISTLAGIGTYGNTGNGGPAVDATLASPCAVAAGPDGSVYIVQSDVVRRVAADGTISIFAGNGNLDMTGFYVDGALPTAVPLDYLRGIAVSPKGVIFGGQQLGRVQLVTSTTTAPGAPTEVVAEPGDRRAMVTWSAPGADGHAPIGSYTVTATDQTSSANGGQSATTAGTSATVSGLTAGDTYTFAVTATNAAGTSMASDPSPVITISGPPAITSAPAASSGMRVPFTFTVTTTGTPVPSISNAGALPAGIAFRDNGDGTATLSGSAAAATAGTYPVTLTASNGVEPDATQSFRLTVTSTTSVASITSGATDTETFGVPFAFTVQTTGYPAPTITKTGALPAGVTFINNGDGTATIGGTPSASALGTYTLTLKAKNSVGTATQTLVLTITKAPTINNIGNPTVHAGTAAAIKITSKGYTVPALTKTGALPLGMTFSDNGNSTASLSGTPGVGSGGAYPLTVTATNQLGTASQSFTLKVNEGPVIASADPPAAVEGSPFSFTATATGYPAPSFSKTGTLPKSITWHASTATFSGTPKPGSHGTYPITITAKNSTSTVTRSFVLTVNSA